VDRAIAVITQAAKGEPDGAGTIFISTLDDAVNIQTGQTRRERQLTS